MRLQFVRTLVIANSIFLTNPVAALDSLIPYIGLDWGIIPPTLFPLLIFMLKVSDVTLATLRMLTVVRGRRATAWIIGFAQATIFIIAVVGVLANLNNPLNVIAYAAGMATGNVLGMTIEAKIAPGHSLLRIASSRRGNAILERLRAEGWGATEVPAQGKMGMVSWILCYVPRRQIAHVTQQIIQTDQEAFITVEQVRLIRGGWNA
jgi:uncharacterized protein YebE (UPF0316 family)